MHTIIGKKVKVTVDRPLGSPHPTHPDVIYPVNYGYVDGIIAPDGEWQDAYILGPQIPLAEFEGTVVAVVKRFDDFEEKWIVTDGTNTYTKEEIAEKVSFIEKYFVSEIVME